MDHDIESTVNGFVRARVAARALAAFPGKLPPDLATAYRCQSAALQRWPDDVAGWKVARIPPPWAAQYTEERLIGPVLRRNVHRPAMGAVVEAAWLLRLQRGALTWWGDPLWSTRRSRP